MGNARGNCPISKANFCGEYNCPPFFDPNPVFYFNEFWTSFLVVYIIHGKFPLALSKIFNSYPWKTQNIVALGSYDEN